MTFKFNPFTGQLDIVEPYNFSIQNILTGQVVCIPENHQMIVHGRHLIDGQLIIDGQLVLF